MKAIVFALFWITAKPLSLLPGRVLYFFADILFVILHYFIRYRRKVIHKNLHESFPDKSEHEIKTIARKFHRHLADIFIEYIILMGISFEQLDKRVQYKNIEYIKDLYARNKDVVMVMGHYGSWEWPCGFAAYTPFGICSVYKQLRNPYFDRFFIKLRSRFGTQVVEMNDAFRVVYARKRANLRTALALIADQSPMWREMKYFTNFLNHPGTPVYLGPERIAKALDMAVVFISTSKPKRGHYVFEIIPLFEDVSSLAPHEITEAHLRMLEQRIQQQPELWLWSHKRWKRMEWDLLPESEREEAKKRITHEKG